MSVMRRFELLTLLLLLVYVPWSSTYSIHSHNLHSRHRESILHSSTQDRHLRFAGVGRLYTDENVHKQDAHHLQVVDRLHNSTVAVVGLGGVGSWSAEALCRSGVGNLILIDLDDICISNSNRQLHTTTESIGRMKIDEMKRRITSINPDCNVSLIHDFISRDNLDKVFDQMPPLDALLDAIDGASEKSALINACVDRQIPTFSVGGAAGRTDPTQIVCTDMTRVQNDKLIGACRKNLRKHYDFAPGRGFRDRGKPKQWNIQTVYSLEPQKSVPNGENSSSLRRCDGALGTACFLTGTFGFVAAERIVDMLAKGKPIIPRKG